MDIKLSKLQSDEVLKRLQKDYRVYAPKIFEGEGVHSYTDSIRYGEINSFSEVVHDKKSQFSPKELLIPINHTLSVKIAGQEIDTTEDQDNRGMLILLRSCDIHGIRRIDNSLAKDKFYRSRRDKVKFMVLECPTAFDTCFCISMGTNKTDNYSLGIRFNEEGVSIKIKEEEFNKYFENLGEEDNFDIRFCKENETKVRVPHIEIWDKVVLDKVMELDLWNSYKNRCIGCGSCNMSCITCSCMKKVEVVHRDNSDLTELRRTWSGCQLIRSSSLKGKSLNDIVPTRIRQRILDKFYRPQLEVSKEQICVGCGRCTDICPRYINFAVTANKLSDELDKIYEELGRKVK